MKSISINNGLTFVSPAEAIAQVGMDAILNMMDDDIRCAVDAIGVDSDEEFLARYLQMAAEDLIIG